MVEIPKIVSQRLHEMESGRVHPDPDLIAALVERSLGNRERVQILEHLSRCASCREIVSLSATQPDNAGAVAVVPSTAGWLSWPVLRWGAAATCVIVVGAAVTLRHKPEAPRFASTAEGKPAAHAQIPGSEGAFANAKKTASLQLPEQEKNGFVTKLAPQPGQATPNSSATRPALVAGELPAPSGVQVPAASGRMFATTVNGQKARTSNPADENYSSATASPVQMADATTTSPLAEVVPGRAKAAFAESSDARAGKTMGGALSRKQTLDVSAAAVGVASDALIPTNLTPRWTLNSDGTLQRSLDSGRTWQTIPVSSKTIFRALAANGLDIWVGGSAGALFHSSDAGQHWTQVRPIANSEPLADDIIGVEFTDLLHGKLTTSSAETWITVDAGQTWQRQ